MRRACWPSIVALGGVAVMLATSVSAQEKQLYRYVDPSGKVVYTDSPPPPSAKDIQQKRLGGNVIETNELPYSTRMASERYPVTLYTFECGEPCQSAVALLNKRGVPYATVNVSEPPGAARLMALTGTNVAPVLQIGDKMVAKGLDEARWQAMLDEVGYPRSPMPRRMPPGKGTEAPPAAAAPSSTTASAAPAAAAPAGGGYPK